MPRSPKVKAAVLERSRRSTAGNRMTSLVGKAQEDDDTFWSHSIWSEAGGGFSDKASRKRRRDEGESSSSGSEGGSGDDGSDSDGEGSFRMSDEDPDVLVDQFDSDFDESESDEEGDDGEGEEEQELRAEERRAVVSKRKKNQRLGVPLKASAGRELMRRKSGKMTKRGPLGEGWNEGLVLNWPPPPLGGVVPAVPKSGLFAAKSGLAALHAQIPNSKPAAIPVAQSVPAPFQTKPRHPPSQPLIHSSIDTKQITISKPPPSPKRHLRAGETSTIPSSAKPFATKTKQRETAASERKKIRKRQFTQEELILESIKSTETENSKWLSARKRTKEDVAQSEKAASAKKSALNLKPISRFHSRRGCNNTLTFMDMDSLPEFLTRRHTAPYRSGTFAESTYNNASPKRRRLGSSTSEISASAQTHEKNHEKCFITGKIARYRDPKTMLGYHDLDAYKEIRRRLEAGELKISQPSRNNNRSRSSSGSNNRGSVNITNFPFPADQPTMVAKMTSARNNIVKVMVSQGGVPVSPPVSKRISMSIKKEPPPLLPSAQQSDNRKIGGTKKEPPPLLPSAEQTGNGKIGDISRFLMGRMDMGMEAEHQHMHYVKVDKSNSKNNVLKPVASNESGHVGSAQPIDQPQKLGATEYTNNFAGNDNRIEDGVQPQMTVSSSAPEVADMMPGANGKEETSSGKSSETKAPSAKDISRKSTDDKKIVPEVTTSATIEAKC